VIETIMGAVVLTVAALFVYMAYTSTRVDAASGYTVTASFGRVGGLAPGSDVRISGIKVGTVVARTLEPVTYDAIVSLSIAHDMKLPEDTIASIVSEGPLGGRYVRLEPGHAQETIPPGGRLRETRGYRSLEDQVGEIIFLATGRSDPPK
jgi:phospholipid/cholesterol/gamma-HCH transport system substrate-binding protein